MTLLVFSLSWLLGMTAAALGLAPFWPWVTIPISLVGVVLTVLRRSSLALALLLSFLAGVAGLIRYETRDVPSPTGLVALAGDEPVILRGVVTAQPEQGERSQRLRLRVEQVDDGSGWQEAQGDVLVITRPFPEFDYGDRLELKGKLALPERLGDFDYPSYLARQGIFATVSFPEVRRTGHLGPSWTSRLIDARKAAGDSLSRSLSEPEASLARGILLGQRQSIPSELNEEFRRSGVSHLIAISGFNVMLVAGSTASALAWLAGRRPATLAGMLAALAFAVFVGGTGSVLRATAMAQVVLGARLVGRPGNAAGALLLAAALLTVWQPGLIDDVGFQLSVAATLGIVLLAEPLQQRWLCAMGAAPGPLAATALELVCVTLAASIAVLPVTLATFGSLPLYSLPANLLAVPAFAPALAAAAVTAVAGLVSEDFGRLVGVAAHSPLAMLIGVARWFAGLPGATVSVGATGLVVALTFLLPFCFLAPRLLRRSFLLRSGSAGLRPVPLFSLVLAVLALFVWRDALDKGDQLLRVTVLDVGQGDAILIETPGGRRLLVDGGPSGARLLRELGDELPPSMQELDLVVLTHAQDDHLTGLVELLERYEVAQVLASPLTGESAAFEAWREALQQEGAQETPAHAGQWLDLGDGVLLEVLWPPEQPLADAEDVLNANSVVLRLALGEVSFLLAGDLTEQGERALLESPAHLRSSVLKVAHHGSDGSTNRDFLDAVSPSVAAISAGEDNPYGHPSPSLLLRLAGVPVLRTDENGTLRFSTDGRNLWVDHERGSYRLLVP